MGTYVGFADGDDEGTVDDNKLGLKEGFEVGEYDGMLDGGNEGTVDGLKLGILDGDTLAFIVGELVGESVDDGAYFNMMESNATFSNHCDE